VDTLVTETIEPPTELIGAARAAGIGVVVSFPCFSAHAWPELAAGFDLHPVLADGRPRQPMEWYTGLIPTHDGYARRLRRLIRNIVAARPAGIVLDFVRWPLHWELELRAGAPEPDESSFDERSLQAFAGWLERRGLRYERGIEPEVLLGPLRDPWTDFKCDVITRFARSAVGAARAIKPDLVTGAFIVPGSHDQRRRLLGQDVLALGSFLDVLLPMTYHRILHEDAGFIGRVVGDIRDRTAAEVAPVVQVTADPEVASPWDWGPDLSAEEFGRAVEEARRHARSLVLFPLEGLTAERREVFVRALGRSRPR
jgi:hypothetical protein